ncbi:MAG: winged helix-turn-helix transcriptional regulator [Tepidiformaceae bacterium]
MVHREGGVPGQGLFVTPTASVRPSGRPFRSCLFIAARGAETLGVVRALHGGNFAVLERDDDASTMRLALSREFDLVLLYLSDRAPAGLRSVAALAAIDVPVIAVLEVATARLTAECLGAGADACLQGDADEFLVVAQVNAVLRRRHLSVNGADTPGILQVGDLSVDVYRCEVERDGVFIPLTASEFRIVEYMARNAGHVLRPHEILNATSGEYEYLPREAQEVFKVYVRRIRRKLETSEDEPRYLVTVRGMGYRLEGGQARGAARSRGAAQTA